MAASVPDVSNFRKTRDLAASCRNHASGMTKISSGCDDWCAIGPSANRRVGVDTPLAFSKQTHRI